MIEEMIDSTLDSESDMLWHDMTLEERYLKEVENELYSDVQPTGDNYPEFKSELTEEEKLYLEIA